MLKHTTSSENNNSYSNFSKDFNESAAAFYEITKSDGTERVVKGVNRVQKEQKGRSKNLIVPGTQPNPCDIEAGGKLFLSEMATAIII